MKIALCQFDPTVGDFSGNSARILAMAGDAKGRGADLAVFSELCVCGYLPQDLLERPAFLERNRATIAYLAAKSSASPSAKISGTTKPSGPSLSTKPIP